MKRLSVPLGSDSKDFFSTAILFGLDIVNVLLNIFLSVLNVMTEIKHQPIHRAALTIHCYFSTSSC